MKFRPVRGFVGIGISPAPHGAGGLKYNDLSENDPIFGPAPHGAGGLKLRPI